MGDCDCGGAGWNPSGSGSSDHKFLVDSADTTAGFATSKLAAGTGITFTVLNPAGNEQLQIAAAAVAAQPLTLDYYVDQSYGSASPNGAINAPFATLQAGINALIAAGSGTLHLTPSVASYGNVTFILAAGQTIHILGETSPNNESKVTIGNITYHIAAAGNSALSLENVTVGNITDASAGTACGLILINSGCTSILGSDFTTLQITCNSLAKGNYPPSIGSITACNTIELFNVSCGSSVSSTGSTLAYDSKFHNSPTSSGTIELHDCSCTDTAGATDPCSADANTESSFLKAGCNFNTTLTGLSLAQSNATVLTDANASLNFSNSRRALLAKTVLTANRTATFAVTGGIEFDEFFIDSYNNTAFTLQPQFGGGTIGPAIATGNWRYIYSIQAGGLNVTYARRVAL